MTDAPQTNPPAGDAGPRAEEHPDERGESGGDERLGPDEFAHIPTSRRGRHPAIALGGALLAFFLVFHIRHDVRYALSSGTPVDLGEARLTLGPRAGLENGGERLAAFENRYVRVAGTPDRESALELDTKGSWTFTQFFRILGTGERLFVHRLPSPLPAALAESDVFEGRLQHVDDLTFADAIRGYFAQHVAATHFFAPEDFLRAMDARSARAAATGSLSLVDRSGDPVALGPDEPLVIDVSKPDQVVVGLPRARFATEGEARATIESQSGEVIASRGLVRGAPAPGTATTGPLSSAPPPPERWTFTVRFAEARRQQALDRLGDIDRLVEIRDAREPISTRLADLEPAPGGSAATRGIIVRAAGDAPQRTIAPAQIAAVHTVAPVLIPSGAFLLVEGDDPRRHLASLLVAVVLVVFAVFNVAGVLRDRAQRGGSR